MSIQLAVGCKLLHKVYLPCLVLTACHGRANSHRKPCPHQAVVGHHLGSQQDQASIYLW